ncbi:MAG: anaerobic ribonucleoside-triphosphate reductase [Clostridia bacterium]|nr:anaerobic ribonucleoside-triphosphate reductase [Clostridia bacterium]
MVKVLKKSGIVEDFNDNKIKKAIEKSAERVVIKLTETQKEQVCIQVKNSLMYTDIVPVSTLHNLVETALDTVSPKVAKSYREYRDNKASFARMLDKVYNKKLSLNFIGDRSNANADSAIVTTQRAIVYNELNSELYKKFFLTVEEEKAMSEGYIYIHDRGSRLDSFNCCLADVKTILTNGFEMGNLDYNEPKTLDVAFDLIGDIIMSMASCQYGGYTISEIDKLLAPYAEKSYNKYLDEYYNIVSEISHHSSKNNQKTIDKNAHNYAIKKVTREFEQGWQGLEMKLNSVGSSRGDYPFTAVSFGLGQSQFETLCTSVALKVRKNGQGKKDHEHPVLFPKLSFLYDKQLHGEGKKLEWLFLEAIDCSSKAMYPDFISCTGDGYCGDIYKKYGKTISRMGCRATLAPWYERGGFTPADEEDEPIFEGRCNMGAISLHFPMILKKAQLRAKKENKNIDEVFFNELEYYCNIIRDIHKRTFDTFAEKKAGTNPLAFCQGGILGGHFHPEQKIGREFLRPMTASFGITALNETQYLYNGKSLVEDQSFAIKILQYMDEMKKRATKEDKILYALYGTPAESLCGLQVEQYRKMFGEQKGITDKPYTSNSFHCAVYEDITPIQKQDIEYKMYHYCTGGAIQYCRYPINYNKKAIIILVRRAMDMGFYEGINLQLDYCEHCGSQFIDCDICPDCGSQDITRIERMNGLIK